MTSFCLCSGNSGGDACCRNSCIRHGSNCWSAQVTRCLTLFSNIFNSIAEPRWNSSARFIVGDSIAFGNLACIAHGRALISGKDTKVATILTIYFHKYRPTNCCRIHHVVTCGNRCHCACCGFGCHGSGRNTSARRCL
jgi:hypothetical protein